MYHSKDLVSIILPNYNHAIYLQERLDSIFNQTYQNFEVIILDDCSTDDSLQILKPYKNHPKVSHFIVNTQNTGSPFKQWQKGLKLSKGGFVWIAESDDFCDLNFLETQLICLESADVAVAKTKASVNGIIKNQVRHPIFEPSKMDDAILHCPILNVSSVVFKASLLQELNDAYYVNFNIMGDRVFYFEYFRDSKIIFNSHTHNYFRQSDSNISKLKDRSLDYYTDYFDEHCRFILYAYKKDARISKLDLKLYISKFYERVRNRVSKDQKTNIAYLFLYLKFKYRLLVN